MEQNILTGIIVFSENEEENNSRTPDGHGSNGGVKSSRQIEQGKGQSNIKALGKSWQKYGM